MARCTNGIDWYRSILFNLPRLGKIDSLLTRLSLNWYAEKLDSRIKLVVAGRHAQTTAMGGKKPPYPALSGMASTKLEPGKPKFYRL